MTGESGRAHQVAVIWDYDGTLVDTRSKNLAVNRLLIGQITGRPGHLFESLSSLQSYQAAAFRTVNWRSFYAEEFGLSESDIDRAAELWPEYQRRDRTPTPAFPGIPETLEALAGIPQGIVSQNGSQIIASVLRAHGLLHHFRAVIGYREVAFERQKPAPDGLLRCIEELVGSRPARVYYVGDHETDAVCVSRAREELAKRGADVHVVSVGALYGAPPRQWTVRPDTVAHRPEDVVEIVAGTQVPRPGVHPPGASPLPEGSEASG